MKLSPRAARIYDRALLAVQCVAFVVAIWKLTT
jgi:hypothetical protein